MSSFRKVKVGRVLVAGAQDVYKYTELYIYTTSPFFGLAPPVAHKFSIKFNSVSLLALVVVCVHTLL